MADTVTCQGCGTELLISPEARAYGATSCSQCGATVPLNEPAADPISSPNSIPINIPAETEASEVNDTTPPDSSESSDSSSDSVHLSLSEAAAGAIAPDPANAKTTPKSPDTARLAEEFSFDAPGLAVDPQAKTLPTTGSNPAFGVDESDGISGKIIAGYRLEKSLGSGAFSEVYLAYHTDIGTPVTFKILRGNLADHTDNDEDTFFKEARMRAEISHPNLLKIIDIGKYEDFYYLITEYVDGPRLEDQLISNGAMTLDAAVPILLQLCSAVNEVHSHGLEHGIINPYNILIDKSGAVKAAVFGLTTLLKSEVTGDLDTVTLERMKYTAPEQIDSPDLSDPRADIYSLGCIFYRLLCGRPPIEGKTVEEIRASQDEPNSADPRGIVPGLPGTAAAAMAKMMHKNPDLRFQSIAEVQAALQGLVTDSNGVGERTKVVDTPTGGTRGLDILLGKMNEYGSSDLHLRAGAPPVYRINGATRAVQAPPLTPEQVQAIVFEVLTPEQITTLREKFSIDFSMSLPDIGRFRMNVYRQRGTYSVCARSVSSTIPTIDGLLLPPAVKQIASYKDGFVLVTGATGSGKSTTLASIIQLINQTRQVHILTIEDPLEYVHQDIMAIVSQREIRIDTPDFATGLRDALRQDPDVILVGELRDSETVETAISASETGHLVMATLHANSATDAIGRLLNFFPQDQHHGLRKLLGDTMRSILRQILVQGSTAEHPRIPALEVLFVNKVVRQCIIDGEDRRIPKQMREFGYEGMQDMNMSLFNLWKAGLITPETALAESPRPDELERTIKSSI